MTVIGKCVRITYRHGDHISTPSYSRRAPGRLRKMSSLYGAEFVDKGNGWAEALVASRLILTVQVAGNQEFEVWIERPFKDKGRLTEKFRQAIANTMPETVTLESKVSDRGTNYFSAAEKELDAWAVRAWEAKRAIRPNRK